MIPDAELLQRYVENHDEGAFAELVRQHLGLVYAAALRRTGGRAHLAEEVAQKVFTDLARKASSLRHHPALSGWLYRSTRYAAVDAIRAEQRRHRLKETLAVMRENDPVENTEVEWERLRPVLDEAMDRLKDADREAMVLRYFEALSFSEVGERLKLSENAARMRTERALVKLRSQLARRGVTSTTTALGLLLANRAVAAAPEGLAGNLATTALAQVAPAAGLGLASVITVKLVTFVAATLCAVSLGVLGWRLVGSGTAAGGKSADQTLVLAADEFAAHAMAVYQIMAQVHPVGTDGTNGGVGSSELDSIGGGQASPQEAHMGFAEASRARDVPRLAQLLTFDARGTEVARSIHAGMPAAMREQLRTPEELFAFFYATDTLLSPVPPAGFLKTFVATELKAGRAAVHQRGSPPRGLEFVLTDEGWKHEVPTPYLSVLTARIVSSDTLAKLNVLSPAQASATSVGDQMDELGTARAALRSFAAACNRGDAATAGALLHFDPPAQKKALVFIATLPPALQDKWRNPVELGADLMVSEAIGNPYPSAAILAMATEERPGEDRVALLLPDTLRTRIEFQRTSTGWKRVITEAMVDDYLRRMATAAASR